MTKARTSVSADGPLAGVIADYLQAIERGESPDRQLLLAAHPDLAGELAAYFVDLDKMNQLAAPLRLQDPDATVPPDAAEPAKLPVVRYIGDYELQSELARGGMGVVYRARQVSLNRPVAVKMILTGQFASAADVQRFKTEAEAAANLDHPNILPIYEVGEYEGQHYFSMKLIDGGSLSANMSDRKNKPREAVALLAKVARAVHFAHQRSILHRDLKPANILIDREGTPFVTDFGLAKRTGEPGTSATGEAGLTHTGAILGTPSYMAPEQARAEKQLTTGVDVYALGAILYELITGQPPFRAATVIDTILLVLEKEPANPRKIHRKADRDLAVIALKCLEKNPAKRYGSAEALAEDLERWLRREPIRARPTSRVRRLWKWCRRHPVAAILSTALLGSILAFFAASEYDRYERKETEARDQLRLAEFRRQQFDMLAAKQHLWQSRSYASSIGWTWRGEALQYVAAAKLDAKHQFRVADEAGLSPEQIDLEWLDDARVRVVTPKTIQIHRIPGGEIESEGPPNPIVPRALEGLPANAKILGRAPGDTWAVLRVSRPPAGEDVVLWDVAGRKVARTLPNVGAVPDYVVMPANGRRMAYPDPYTGGAVRLWDWDRNMFVGALNVGAHTGDLPGYRSGWFESLLAFSPDGELLANVGPNSRDPRNYCFQVWQAETGKLVANSAYIGSINPKELGHLRWSPDGHWLAATGKHSADFYSYKGQRDGYFLKLWEMHYPSPSYRVPNIETVYRPLTISPNSEYVAWQDTLWQVTWHADQPRLVRLERDRNTHAICAADGAAWVAGMTNDTKNGPQVLKLRRVSPGPLERSFQIDDTADPPESATESFRIQQIDIVGNRVLIALEQYEWKNQDGRRQSKSTGRFRLEIWDIEQGRRVAIWNQSALEEGLRLAALTADGAFAVTIGSSSAKVLNAPAALQPKQDSSLTIGSSSAKVWNTATGRVEHSWPLSSTVVWADGPILHYTAHQVSAKLSADRRHLAISDLTHTESMFSERGSAALFEVATGRQVHDKPMPIYFRETTGAFHAGANWHASWTSTPEGTFLTIYAPNARRPNYADSWAATLKVDAAQINAVEFSPDGRLLVIVSDGVLRLWPLDTFKREVDRLETYSPFESSGK